jgi:xanthine/CO dehydrogenase XdhC/CoxF family maturation factor
VRRPGTVLVVTEAGQTIGSNPAGPLDGAIRDLAAEALATGQARLEHLRIDADAASYVGLSGEISLEIHAMRVPAPAPDPAFAAALRHLDSGTAAVLIIGYRRSGRICHGRSGPCHRSARSLRLPANGHPGCTVHAGQPPDRIQSL